MASQVILSTHPQLYLMLESSALRYPAHRLGITICFSLPMVFLLPNLSLRIWGGGGNLLT
jgi:hypothetical protein